MSNSEHWDLLAKYLQGEASEQEKAVLFAWMEKQPDNRALFDHLTKVWGAVGSTDESYVPNVDKGWQKFQSKAGIPRETALRTETNLIDHQQEAKTVKLQSWTFITKMAAAVLVLVGVIYLVSFYIKQTSSPVAYTTQNEKQEIFLPDSSRVVLNKNSSLKYTPRFNEQDRVVYLTGEAFFEVRKANGKTFTVFSGNTQTQVLGTSFTVSTHKGKTEVQVVTGKVAFSTKEDSATNKVLLTPGFKAVEESNGKISKSQITDTNFLAWKDNKLTFNNTSMQDVIATLENYFGVPIKVADPKLLQCRFTGSYTEPTLQEIIDVLVVSVDLVYTNKDGQYTLFGTGCK